MGDQVQEGTASTQTSDGGGWFHSSGFMDKVKKGWKTVQDKSTEAAHQGMDSARQFAKSPTGQQIKHEAVQAGKEVYDSHKKEALGVVHGVQTGNVNEVLRNGAPLAVEAVAPPLAARAIVQRKALEVASKHVSPEHRDSIQKAADVIGTHGFSDLTIGGVIRAQAKQKVADAATQPADSQTKK